MGYIYKITNNIDKKVYIGQTVHSLEERWKQHKKSSSNCKYLKAAFNKYGIANFTLSLVCISFDECLNDLEIEYIKKYNSLVPNGYNLRNGGNNGKLHEETKNKISQTVKQNINVITSRRMLGMTHSETTKKIISAKLSGRTIPENVKYKQSVMQMKGKVIVQYDLHGTKLHTYESYMDIKNKVGYSYISIYNARRNNKPAHGYIWKLE